MIEKKIKKIFYEDITKKKLTLNSDLISSNILDSFSVLVLISRIEKEFKMKIKMKKFELRYFKTIKSIINYINSCKK